MGVLNPGDVVQLKSGGEGKTVLNCDGEVTVTAFTDWGTKTEQRNGYPTACLMLVPTAGTVSATADAGEETLVSVMAGFKKAFGI